WLVAGELRGEAVVEGKLPTIVGYAAVYRSLSEDLGGFREILKPGVFSRSLKSGADVRALVDHNPSLLLGRSKAGTLRLAEDDRGLRVEIDPPNTTAARDLVENLRLGNVSGMSFRFYVEDDAWTNDDAGPVREVRSAAIDDVSVVTYPAYPATEVALRSLEAHRRSQPRQTPRRSHAERLVRLALAD